MSSSTTAAAHGRNNGLDITAAVPAAYAEILTPAATAFLAGLHERFEPRRQELLRLRQRRQEGFDRGELPDFLPETAAVRAGDWKAAAVLPELADRRVEITGPVDRKMIINALNSGANVYMADFEDSTTPTWANLLDGQINLRDAVRGTIRYDDARGRAYRLGANPAVLMVRPRGWHLDEAHVRIDGRPISGSLFDFGLFFFHNAAALLERGSAPYFYLPKLESHLEARLWNDVFLAAQAALGLAPGTIRATVLIETISAAFEMDEILWELRQHSAGLNCGRWDYIFSFIKKFRQRPDFVLPNRSLVTMNRHFLASYVRLLIATCHRRGVHAMGGMAAQVPIKDDAEANRAALERVHEDKLREVQAGHDGTWVAHPGLVALAREVFDAHMPGANQIDVARNASEPPSVTAADLLQVPGGEITEAGLRWNLDVGLRYLNAWVQGTGCVPIYHLMEDAATAEICRAQVWQWLRHGARLNDGRTITVAFVEKCVEEQLARWSQGVDGVSLRPDPRAVQLFRQLLDPSSFPEFLTLAAYATLE